MCNYIHDHTRQPVAVALGELALELSKRPTFYYRSTRRDITIRKRSGQPVPFIALFREGYELYFTPDAQQNQRAAYLLLVLTGLCRCRPARPAYNLTYWIKDVAHKVRTGKL